MKKIRVIIRDSNTLVLQENGEKDDIIDLRELAVDHTLILDAIKHAKDEEYEKLKSDLLIQAGLEKNNALLKAKRTYDQEVEKITNSLKDKENELKSLSQQLQSDKEKAVLKAEKIAVEALHDKETELNTVISDLQHQLDVLKKTQDQQLKTEKQQIELAFQKQIAQKEGELEKFKSDSALEKQQIQDNLKQQLATLGNQHKMELKGKESDVLLLKEKLENIKKDLELQHSNATLQLKHDLEERISSKELEISNIKAEHANVESKLHSKILEKETELETIKREKGQLSIKQIGESLENWCNEQWRAISLYGFKTSTFNKDNTSVKVQGETKGTKGDYIFEVFNHDGDDKVVLTSAMCEMKSEQLESDNKKKNADHYKKLDSDRTKKGMEYAILVSELEYTYESDAPVFVVPGYEKMYVVRPMYFMTLLGIIESIGLKYAELITQKELEKVTFKDMQDILDEFEAFKNNILDNSLRHINTHLESIRTNAQRISAEASKILELVNTVVDTHLNTVKNKIEGFSIKSLTRKIERV